MRQRVVIRQFARYGFFLGIAVIITWPAATNLGGQFIGGTTSDAYEMARHIWYFKTALQNGQSPFFQANLGYPDGISGVTLWANPLQFFPAWLFAFFLPLSLAYNLSILLTMALNGWAMSYLMRALLNDELASLLAGTIFMAAPIFQGHLFDGHAGLMVLWPLPLLVYYVHRWRQGGARRDGLMALVYFVLTPSGHMLQIIYILAPLMGVLLMGRLAQRDWVGARQLVTLGIAGGALLLLFLAPILGETLNTVQYVDVGGSVRYSADLLSIVSPAFEHPFYKQLLDYPRAVLGTNVVEGAAYIGLFAGILALVAIWRCPQARQWFVLGLVAWVLSLGPFLKIWDRPLTLLIDNYETLVPMPFAMVAEWPIFNLARTPGRFSFLLAFAVAALAGYSWAALFQRARWRRLLWVVALALILWDYQLYSVLPSNTMPVGAPSAIAELADRDDVRAVFDVPWDNLLAAKDALYLQTIHQKPLIAGQVSRQTPIDPAKLSLLQETLAPDLLRQAGADVVIVHKGRAGADEALALMTRARAQLGAPLYEDERLALFQTPVVDKAADFVWMRSDDSAGIRFYLYTPQSIWADLEALLVADRRSVVIELDGQPLGAQTVDETRAIHMPFLLGLGYHTVYLRPDPPCPRVLHPALVCRDLDVTEADWRFEGGDMLAGPILFAEGLALMGARLDDEGDVVVARLWWQSDAPRVQSDIRFLHLLTPDGALISQSDQSAGDRAAGAQWTEIVALPKLGRASDDYRVALGWYRLPDVKRFDVLSDVAGASDDLVQLHP